MLFHDCRSQTIAAWSRETGIPWYVIASRLKIGWSVAKALTTPVKARVRVRNRTRNRKIIRRIAFAFSPGINLNEVLTAADFMVNEPLTGGYPTTSALPKGTGGPRHARHADQCSGPCNQISGLPSPAETRA